MAGLVVFCCPQVLFEIPHITFTNEEYANLHFVCGSCDGYGRAAWVEYKHCYPGCRFRTGTQFRMYVKFCGRLVLSQTWMQNMGNHCLKVTFWMQLSKTRIQCTQNMLEDWYCTNSAMFAIIINCKRYKTVHWMIMQSVYSVWFQTCPWYIWGLHNVDCYWLPTSAA
jgi:hypothetical protein